MSRISIDVTKEQHNRLKAVAALSGKSLKDYVLEKTLPYGDEEAMQELETLLQPRIAQAKKGEFVDESVDDIANEVYKDLGL